MNSYDSLPTSEVARNGSDDPEAIRARIERARAELSDDVDASTAETGPRTRARQALATAKDKATAAASRTRAAARPKAQQAGQAVRGNPRTTTAATLLVVLAATAGTVLTSRRRAAKARAARSRWSRFTGR
jgi:triphosphoribosyl-dephospho-CoA synthetase